MNNFSSHDYHDSTKNEINSNSNNYPHRSILSLEQQGETEQNHEQELINEPEPDQEQDERDPEEQVLIERPIINSLKIQTDPKPYPTYVFLICSITCLALFLSFFLFAPSISNSFFHNITSSSSLLSTDHKKPANFTKPVGPPGSITDKTDVWANQGGAWKNFDDSNTQSNSHGHSSALFSNGTHQFNKTLIIVSLDGFRAEYLERGITPRLTTIKEKHGICAEYLEPQFPTLTFPNHWSMLTGLHPESHGIVANDFRDPHLGKSFSNVDPHKSWDPVWWSGEPIWATATKHGLRTAVSMWPGPPYTSDKTRPTYWRAYEDPHKWWEKIRQLETWLDLPLEERPEFIALYNPEVDQMGHQYGPNHEKFSQSLQDIDQFVGALYDCLKARNMTDIVDVIYVGDHGMMATSDQRIVYLDQILGKTFFDQIQFQDGWPAAGLRFPSEVNTQPILEQLISQAKIKDGFEVYTHQTMPKRWHFTQNDRIAPMYVFPKPGWVISNTHEHQVVMNATLNVKGVHGYDNQEEFMRSIFIGHGPFSKLIKQNQLRSIRQGKLLSREEPNPLKPKSISIRNPQSDAIVVGRLPPFSNLEVYSLISKILNLDRFIDFNQKNCSIEFWNQYF